MQAAKKLSRVNSNPKIRVLIADNDQTSLFLIASQLEDMDYDVVTADNGFEALKILKALKQVDAIILNLDMPGMNGMEVARRIKLDDRFTNIVVIFASEPDVPKRIKESVGLGVFYHLTKPLVREVLKTIISTAMKDMDKEKNF